jgi:gas vesicle protein
MGKFINGITTGAIVGATIGMMVAPQLDRNTRKRLKKTGKKMVNVAGDLYDNMMNMSR